MLQEVNRILPDGAISYGGGVIGPSSADIARVNSSPIEIFENQAQDQKVEAKIEETRSWAEFTNSVLKSPKLRPLMAPALSLAIAACNTGATQTDAPKNTYEPTPAQTQAITLPPTAVESPQPTVVPTLEPTPTLAPTPEPTEAPKPMNLTSLLELQPTKIDRTKVKDTLVAAWNRIQQLETEGKISPDLPKYTLEQFLAKWDNCTGKVDSKITINRNLNREVACRGHITYMSRIKDPSNPTNMDPIVYPAAQIFLFDAETTLPDPWKTDMINFLKAQAAI